MLANQSQLIHRTPPQQYMWKYIHCKKKEEEEEEEKRKRKG